MAEETLDFIDGHILRRTVADYDKVNRHDIGDDAIVSELHRAEGRYRLFVNPNIKLRFTRVVCKTLRGVKGK